jgi:hypothetical protein
MPSKGYERMSFRFGVEIEVRYLSRVPEIGDYVTHGGEIWVVSVIEEQELGALVTCERLSTDD